MKLLIIALIALAAPDPALANGSPCGAPPKLESAEAARAIDAAVRADLGAAPVETPFLDRARQSVDELARTYGVSRADVVARYVFQFCEALYARGTDGQQLSQLIARVEDALDQPAPDKQAERDTTAPAVDSDTSGQPGKAAPARTELSGPSAAGPADDDELAASSDAPAPQAAEAEQPAPAAERAEQQADGQDRAAAQSAEAETSIAGESPKGTDSATDASRAAGSKNQAAQGAKMKRRAYRYAPSAKQGRRIGQSYTAPNGIARPKNNSGTNFAFRPPVSASPGSGGQAPRPAPQPQAAPAPAQPTPNTVITTPRSAEGAPPSPQIGTGSTPDPAATPQPIADAADPAASETAASEAETAASPTTSAEPASDPEAAGAEAPQSQTTAPAASQPDPETTNALAGATAAARAPADQGACPDRGVLGPECFDVDAALERLRDRPVEYNHPEEMIKGQATEISLALRTDFTEEGLPEETSEAFEGLQGEVKQQRAAIANIMSARLRGRDFEVDPKGMQERTVTWRRPVEWSWYVTPKSGGEAKRLELELYAHIVNPQGETQPPVLIKTLDATIDVDVRTLDWLIEQARTFEPLYAVAAAIIGLLTALLTLWLRRRPAHLGDGPPSGITTSPTPPQRRVSDMSASEAAAEAARKGQEDADKGNGRA